MKYVDMRNFHWLAVHIHSELICKSTSHSKCGLWNHHHDFEIETISAKYIKIITNLMRVIIEHKDMCGGW